MGKVFNIIVIGLWVAGCVALFVDMEITAMLWAFPAGSGAGTALATIKD